jgi:hypothetical protein
LIDTVANIYVSASRAANTLALVPYFKKEFILRIKGSETCKHGPSSEKNREKIQGAKKNPETVIGNPFD